MVNLKELFLWVKNISGPGLTHLGKLPNLRYLYLKSDNRDGKCKFGDSSLKYLKDIPPLRSIRIWWELPITGAGLEHLADYTQLEELELGSLPTTDTHLARFKALPRLRKLGVGGQGSKVTDEGLAHISQIKSLESLSLPSILSDTGVAHLSQLPNLKSLTLGGDISDAGVSHLAGLQRLETLELRSNQVTDSGVSHIGQLTNLRTLRLYGTQMTNAGLAKLANLKSLEKLTINGKRFSLSGLNQLNGLTNLTRLRVNGPNRDDQALDISGLTGLEDLSISLDRKSELRDSDLACIGKLEGLRSLQVCHRGISDEGLRNLAGLTNLRRLSVGGDNVSDDGLAYLANMKGLTNVTLSGNFTDKGLRHLEKVQALCVLDFMRGANFSARALSEFRRKMPHLMLYRDFAKPSEPPR